MRMLGGNCVLRSAVKNSEKKSEKPRTSVSRDATRIMLCLAPGILPALHSYVSPAEIRDQRWLPRDSTPRVTRYHRTVFQDM